METGIPKISVVIITYNQEDTIGRALDSVLVQKEYIYEIIVSDDSSNDKNWEVIQEYKKKYPYLLKIYRNERNLGIFKHIERTWLYPTGDLIIDLSGDDAICNGLFKQVTDYIFNNKINYKKGAFSIFTDFKIIYPNGNEKIHSNKMIENSHDTISLKIRQLIFTNRGQFLSKKMWMRFNTVEIDIGLYTDGLYDIQRVINSDRNYYVNFVGAIYYAGIGISSKISKKENSKSRISLYKEYLKNLNLNNKDRSFLYYNIKKDYFFTLPLLKTFIRTWLYYFTSINVNYGCAGLQLKYNVKVFLTMLKILIKKMFTVAKYID